MNRGRTPCPSGKYRYRDALAARTALALIHPGEKRREARAYRCSKCNGYHLTSWGLNTPT